MLEDDTRQRKAKKPALDIPGYDSEDFSAAQGLMPVLLSRAEDLASLTGMSRVCARSVLR